MLEKYFTAEGYIVTPKQSMDCPNGSCDWLKKEAAATQESINYFNNLKPKADYIYLLVVAMTDSLHYGPNRNGDYFEEKYLKKYHHLFKDAGVFWNHDNKDKSKSSGKVLESFYNDKMHRVELIIEIHKDKARHIPTYIEQGKPIAVSMGLQTPFEICSICGHVTKNSYANRCQHLKYQMNQVLPDGRKVYAISGIPYKLFDISIVTRPADKIAYTLMTKRN